MTNRYVKTIITKYAEQNSNDNGKKRLNKFYHSLQKWLKFKKEQEYNNFLKEIEPILNSDVSNVQKIITIVRIANWLEFNIIGLKEAKELVS